jgi:hypothetical protein
MFDNELGGVAAAKGSSEPEWQIEQTLSEV